MKKKPVQAINIFGEIKYYPSKAEAARETGCALVSVRKITKNKQEISGREAWRFKEITQEEYEIHQH